MRPRTLSIVSCDTNQNHRKTLLAFRFRVLLFSDRLMHRFEIWHRSKIRERKKNISTNCGKLKEITRDIPVTNLEDF